jgi:GNAT superfamily N-acetyltransferase
MPIEIRRFTDEHIEDAAALLAARHAVDRGHTPEFPARFESAADAQEQIARELARPGTSGVLATRDGRACGFLLGAVVLPPPDAFWAAIMASRSVEMPYAGYAAADDDPEIYREMYAALAPAWLRAGCFAHYIEVHADDRTARDAWFSLGFGRHLTLALRDTGPVGDARMDGPALEVHAMGTEDIETVMELGLALWRHHGGSPIFVPQLPEAAAPMRAYQQELLANEANRFWVAYQDGRPVGMQTFHLQTHAAMARPEPGIYLFEGFTRAEGRGGGIGTALLRHSMAWARDAGFDHCTLHYFSANVSGARFWRRSGFRPVVERLCRRLDERIAWATA